MEKLSNNILKIKQKNYQDYSTNCETFTKSIVILALY